MDTKIDLQEMVTHPSLLARPLLKANFRVFSNYCFHTFYALMLTFVGLLVFELPIALLFSGASFTILNISFGYYWVSLSKNISVLTENVRQNMNRIDTVLIIIMVIEGIVSFAIIILACSGYSIILSPTLIRNLTTLAIIIGISYGLLMSLYLIVYIKIRILIQSTMDSLIKNL
jgi:hypothetical protein